MLSPAGGAGRILSGGRDLTSKADIRVQMKTVLAGVAPERRDAESRRVCGIVADWEAFASAGVVMMYAPMAGEVDIRPLGEAALAAGKRVCIPRVDWSAGRMVPAAVSSLETGLKAGRHGVMEPPEGAAEAGVEEIDLVIVPGLAFDRSGNRLGRGAGFYDRFLAGASPRTWTCGVGLDEQLIGHIPTDAWDHPLRAVATPSGLVVIG